MIAALDRDGLKGADLAAAKRVPGRQQMRRPDMHVDHLDDGTVFGGNLCDPGLTVA
jgi:hypothetical protein